MMRIRDLFPMMRPVLALAVVAGVCGKVRADEFARLEGRVLADLPGSEAAEKHESLSMEQIGTLPRVLSDVRSSVLIVKTGEGNPARLLVSLGYRKPSGGDGEPVPILVLDRFDTFEAGPATTKLARGRNLMLFPGFLFDLDSGQVVPENQGGDLRFSLDEQKKPRLDAIAPAAIYTLSRSPLSESSEPGKPSPGRTVKPGDFGGRYRLVANGQWTGTLDIQSDEQGVIIGRFRSDETGSSYRVAGQVDTAEKNLAQFSVILPRARMEFDGRLWTQGKGAMAGTMTLLDQIYGFFALRENSAFTPEDVETPLRVSSIEVEPDHVIELRPDGSQTLDGEATTRQAMLETLGKDSRKNPELTVLVQAPAASGYGEVAELLKRVREAGIAKIRLRIAPEGEKEGHETR